MYKRQTTYYIKIYPNPTNDKLNIVAPKDIIVSLFDIQGRELFKQKDATQIDMSSYASGVYIIQFTNAEGQVIAKKKVSKMDY